MNNAVSDNSSESISDTESVEIEDFEEVHTQLVQIQRTHEEAIALLERIQKQCSPTIRVIQGVAEVDLEEVIEDLHQKALSTILQTGQNPFGSHLLAMIDSIKN
jgi:hypothetical protein